MQNVPITHITLYKHGVGYYVRRAKLEGDEVKLPFRVGDMNDILKSLTAIDWGGGQVLGVDYATPQSSEERLSGCSVHLDNDRSLRDLLISLRGRRVQLLLDDEAPARGILVGLDEVSESQPLDSSQVSLLQEETTLVKTANLGQITGVEILDDTGASDLQFFLETAVGQDDFRQVTIRLTPGEHDLAVSYIAPAPTWRVSYRLVVGTATGAEPRALLLGWGIFDNKLEEDLDEISLSLVAGMPISFVYDLYTPQTPERPVVEDKSRIAAAPVEFSTPIDAMPEYPAPPGPLRQRAGLRADSGLRRAGRDLGEVLSETTAVTTTGKELEELFQYVIGTPVSVRRGQSAMVPIVSADLGYRKELIYNTSRLPDHPVATHRLENETGLTLERGPVTVLGAEEYLGEAILPFTVAGGKLQVPYAVELTVKVHEEKGNNQEIHGLVIKGAYLHFEEWHIRWTEYQLNNSGGEPVLVLVEHPRRARYDLFDAPVPIEKTEEHFRFEVKVPGRGEAVLRIQERMLQSRREELQDQSYQNLQEYLREGLIDRGQHDYVVALLELWTRIDENEKKIAEFDGARAKIYEAQRQIQGNMGALGTKGAEGNLRARYVKELEATETQLKDLAQREASLKGKIDQIKDQIEEKLATMK